MRTAYSFVWEYRVKADRRADFIAAYGPDGVWADWFRGASGYLGTALMEDPEDRLRVVTIDYFTSKSARDDFVAANLESYGALDAIWDSATERETKLGEYQTRLPF